MQIVNKKLPDFSRPPLTEVVLSIQYETLGINIQQAFEYWKCCGSDYPYIEEHPPVEPVIERYGVGVYRTRQPSFTIFGTPPTSRFWFLDETKRELIQIQQDRFIRNWRKIDLSDEYPRYDNCIRPKFVSDVDAFDKFLAANKIGDLVVNQCEVTYINHINICDVWRDHSDFSKVFNISVGKLESDLPLYDEYTKINLKKIIKDKDNQFIGRLHIDIEPAFSAAKEEPIFVLTLTARGKPIGEGFEGVMNFMDLGRECIVMTFKAITSHLMHDIWGYNNGR